MDFDDVLKHVGGWGKYQKRFYLMVSLTALVKGFQVMLVVFTAFVPKHRCAVPGLTKDTYEIQSEEHRRWVMEVVPWRIEEGEMVFDQCSIFNNTAAGNSSKKDVHIGNSYLSLFDTPQGTYAPDQPDGLNISSNLSSATHSRGSVGVMPCSDWVYDTSEMTSTLIAKFSLVCQRRDYRAHSNMMLMAGFAFGSVIASLLCDWLGRKRVLCSCLMLMITFGVASAFPTSIELLMAFRFLSGTGLMGVMVAGFVLAVEMVDARMRTRLGVAWQIIWLTGPFLLAAVSYGLRDWQTLQLTAAFPPFLFLSYWWLIPESPRWLLSRRRTDEAIVILKKIAKVNGTTLIPHTMERLLEANRTQDGENSSASHWVIFTHPKLLVRFLIISFNWFVIAMTYYGLSLNVSNLSGGLRVNFIVSCVVEMIGYISATVFLDIFGRKKVHVVSISVAGASCLLTILTVLYAGKENQWVTTTLASLGKLGISSSFAVIFLYSAELYPTVLRNFGVGCGSVFARVGSMVSPYIADLAIYLDGESRTAIPMVVFGGAAVAAGVTSLFLPETLHRKLPETIQDAIHFGSQVNEAQLSCTSIPQRKLENRKAEVTVVSVTGEVDIHSAPISSPDIVFLHRSESPN